MGKIVTTSKLSGARLHQPYTQSILSLSVAALFTTMSVPSAEAAGLGRLTVQSALGQPLKAEVEVTSLTEDEASSLTAKLANPDAFRQAGLEFNPALSSLRFQIRRASNGRAAVAISSSRPINEPFVDLLVELNWASGKFVREYTFLLDPPELRLGQSESVPGGATLVTPAPVPQQPVATAQPLPVAKPVNPISQAPASQPAPVAAAQPAPKAEPTPQAPATAAATSRSPAAANPSVVQVVRGDTLGDIARRLQPGSATLEQAIVAIYRANPDAFFGSVHQLRAGTTLVVPSTSEMAALSSADVRAEIKASNQTWREYRARLASTTRATTKLADGPDSSAQASGTISAAPTGTSLATDDGDQLKLSRESSDSATAAAGAGTAAAVENSIARDSALQEAQSRVTELERNVNDLQRLLELKNKQLSDLSDQVATLETSEVEAKAAGTTSAQPAATGTVDDTQSTPLPTVAATETTTDSATSEPAAASDTNSNPAVAPTETTATQAGEAATAAKEAVTGTAATEETSAVDTSPTAPASPAPVSWLDSMMANPLLPIGLTGLIALVGGLFFWRRRKGKEDVEQFEDTLGGEDAFAANSLFGTTGGQDVDTSNSLFQTEAGAVSAGESTVDVHSTEVDPIAEAEVYIAYGREAQAEEILKEALKRQPERQAIRLKLLEIFAGRKDAGAYSALAREMYDMTNGQNEEWPKVITMGLAIDPDNSLYTGEGDGIAPEDFPTTTFADSPKESSGKSDSSVAGAAAAVAGAAGASALVDALGSQPEAATESPDSAMDMDMTMPDTLASAPPTSNEPTLAASDTDELGSLDFDLDISTEMDPQPDTLAAISDTGIAPDTGMSLDATPDDKSLNDAISNSVEMPSLEFGSDLAEPDAIADLSVDIPSLDTPTAMAGAAGDALDTDVDLSAIGLDLEPSGADAAPAGSEPARWQEMATKLDLASAYEEIGDKEGARELLDEVIKGGDNAQQQKARAMLSKIS